MTHLHSISPRSVDASTTQQLTRADGCSARSSRVVGVLAAVIMAVSPLASVAATPVALAGAQPQASQVDVKRDYVLGAGDVIRVTVFQNPDLTLETRVSESGTITYPLLGAVKVGGLSVSRAEAAIADGLRTGSFVRQPQVSVLVLQVRGNQASVLGMVSKPGRYPIEVNGMRVSELLAVAGGAAPGGSDVVVLNGVRDGKPFRQDVDIGLLFTGGSAVAPTDTVVQDGDTIYVERMPMVYIYGEVQRAGSMRLERGMTVMQVLANGGGLTQRGTVKGLKVHRREATGTIKVIQPELTDALQPNDVVYVQESLF